MSNLSAVIKSIQDVMRQDSGLDGDAQRISQLTWLLFLKVFDALEEELELTRDDYRSPIPEDMRWRHWAADAEGITGDALLSFVDNELFVTLKSLSADPVRNPRGFVVRSVFEDAYNYMKSGQLLRQVINKLNAIDFNRQSERHQFNDLYEKILKDLQSAGNAGEFYTPRAVTQFMVDMVDPRLGERVFDPATGTGGFLVCAIEHLRRQVHNTEQEAVLQASVLGVEKKQLPHMLCVTNLMLHGIEVPSAVRHDNTLARPLRDYGAADRVDVVLTNPPFGGIEEPGIEQGYPADVRTKETADLFLVLIQHLLKHNGRAALVLPDGTLFGEVAHQGATADRVQPAHHRAAAERGVRAVHGDQDQPAVLHQGGADQGDLVLRASLSGGREELQQDQADPDRGVRGREGVVGPRGGRVRGAGGTRAGVEGGHRGDQGGGLEPRPEEPARAGRGEP
jgi:type I restriction enzyme M protein